MKKQRTLLLTLIFQLTAILTLDSQIDETFKRQGIPVVSIEQLYGDWTCVNAIRFSGQEYVPSDKHLHDFRLKRDSIMYFEYPCASYGYDRIDSLNSLSKSNPIFNRVKFFHDTLVTYSDLLLENEYRFYVRDTFNQKIVDLLTLDGIYLPSMFGKWYLKTQDCQDYSGEPPMKINYPVYFPRIYKFDKSDIKSNNVILININGTLREFKIIECSIYESYIELESEGWCKTKFRVTYYSKFKEQDDCGNPIIYR